MACTVTFSGPFVTQRGRNGIPAFGQARHGEDDGGPDRDDDEADGGPEVSARASFGPPDHLGRRTPGRDAIAGLDPRCDDRLLLAPLRDLHAALLELGAVELVDDVRAVALEDRFGRE